MGQGRSIPIGLSLLFLFVWPAAVSAQTSRADRLADLSEYVDAVSQKAKQLPATARGTTFQQRVATIGDAIGIAPSVDWLRYLGALDGEVGRAIAAAALQDDVDPNLLAATLFREGLDKRVKTAMALNRRGDYQPGSYAFNGFGDHGIGAEAFAAEMADLKRNGFLRQDYDGIVLLGGTFKNENHDDFPMYQFKNWDAAAEGVGALLKARQKAFFASAAKQGIDVSWMGRRDVDEWTYVFYNVSPRGAAKKLRDNWGKLPRADASAKGATTNAAVVGGGSEMLRACGVLQDPCGSNVSRIEMTYPAGQAPWELRAPTGGQTANAGFHH